jgi:hypothetical protein
MVALQDPSRHLRMRHEPGAHDENADPRSGLLDLVEQRSGKSGVTVPVEGQRDLGDRPWTVTHLDRGPPRHAG